MKVPRHLGGSRPPRGRVGYRLGRSELDANGIPSAHRYVRSPVNRSANHGAGDGVPSATPAATPSPVPTPSGPGQHSFHVFGSGTYPVYTVVTPADWDTGDGAVVFGPEGKLALSVWDVGQVLRDPCHWSTTLRDPRPGVDALARALTSQAGRRATASAKVTLASQSGQYLAWSVPKWVVTGDGEFAGCDDAGDGRHECVGALAQLLFLRA